MHKVLFIAYFFPPIGGGGVQRTLKFAKYLPLFNWNPIILTVKNPYFTAKDYSLLKEIENLKVYRTFSLESKIFAFAPTFLHINPKWIHIPDEQIGWFPFAVSRGKKIIEKEKIELLFSTSTPFTDHLIALWLKKKTNLPWVADFRDPWITHYSYPTSIHKKIEEKMEKDVIENADKIISINELMKEEFIERYSYLPKEKFISITNGYDEEDFKNIEVKKNKKFTFAHVGSVYSPDHCGDAFLDAINEICSENEDFRSDFESFFVGYSEPHFKKLAEKYCLNKQIKFISYVEHRKSIEYMKSSDVLLLFVGSKSRISKLMLTGKIFEYLATKVPILAIVPNGIASELIKETKSGVVANPDNIEEVKNLILNLYEKWKKNELKIEPNFEMIKKYERKNLTKELADVFNSI